MIQQSFGRSTYRIRRTQTGCSFEVFTNSCNIALFLDEDEARKLIENLQKELSNGRGDPN